MAAQMESWILIRKDVEMVLEIETTRDSLMDVPKALLRVLEIETTRDSLMDVPKDFLRVLWIAKLKEW